MSKYTTEVRYICESLAGVEGSRGFNEVDEIIETACPLLFNFDFPIFDESYRLVLEKKILSQYYTREICEESVGLWKLRLKNKLNLIMPYYNQLYKSETLDFNPLYDVDYTTEYSRNNGGNTQDVISGSETENKQVGENRTKTVKTDYGGITTNKGNSTTTNNLTESDIYIDLKNDTPQGGIEGFANNSLTFKYLSEAQQRAGSTSNTGDVKLNVENSDVKSGSDTVTVTIPNDTVQTNGTINTDRTETHNINTLEEYVSHISGKQGYGSMSKLLEEYRQTMLNIDQMVIEALNDLFFGLWE